MTRAMAKKETEENKEKKGGQSKEAMALAAAQSSAEKAHAIGNLLNRHIDNKNPTDEERRAIQQVFVDYPEMWTTIGDTMKQAILATVDKAAPGFSAREAMLKGCSVIRDDLGYKGAPKLEQLLIRQIVLCWLRLGIIENLYAQAVTASGTSIEQAMYWERRLSMTQVRYLKATETLARVRKLSRSVPLQVNIATQGGQQINMAGGTDKDDVSKAG